MMADGVVPNPLSVSCLTDDEMSRELTDLGRAVHITLD